VSKYNTRSKKGYLLELQGYRTGSYIRGVAPCLDRAARTAAAS